MFNPFKQHFWIIEPYVTLTVDKQYLYAFDDEKRGLKVELFEHGISAMIALLRHHFGWDEQPILLTFSNKPFDGCFTLTRAERDRGGYWYYCKDLRMCGWLCPMLFKYFPWAPKHIYAQVTVKER